MDSESSLLRALENSLMGTERSLMNTERSLMNTGRSLTGGQEITTLSDGRTSDYHLVENSLRAD